MCLWRNVLDFRKDYWDRKNNMWVYAQYLGFRQIKTQRQHTANSGTAGLSVCVSVKHTGAVKRVVSTIVIEKMSHSADPGSEIQLGESGLMCTVYTG